MLTCTCPKPVLPNDVSGKNRKIRRGGSVSFDLSAGPGKSGGSCLFMTAGCQVCYAAAGEKAMGSMGGLHEANTTLAQRDPGRYADMAIAEIRAEQARRSRARVQYRKQQEYLARGGTFPPRVSVPVLDATGAPVLTKKGRPKLKWTGYTPRKPVRPYNLIRIHGYGDFLGEQHVRAWIKIAQAFPGIRFFGTTRAWQLYYRNSPEARVFLAALHELRGLPNVFLGASIDHDTITWPDPPTRLRDRNIRDGSLIRFLKAHGWNIWNALIQYRDDAARRADGVGAMRTEHDHGKAEGQFEAARRHGWLIGTGCLEQAGKRADCSTCGHCAQKGADVTFAYHSGGNKDETPDAPSYVKNRDAWLRKYGFEPGTGAQMQPKLGPTTGVVFPTPVAKRLAMASEVATEAAQAVRENPRRRSADCDCKAPGGGECRSCGVTGGPCVCDRCVPARGPGSLPPVTAEMVDRVARAFVSQLRRDLGPSKWAEVRKRNATTYAGTLACASHDFIDANMVMDEVIRLQTGVTDESDAYYDWATDLRNAAWDLAKRKYGLCGARPTNRNPRKIHALVPSEREKECDHLLLSYSGRVPNTGPVICRMCGTKWPDMESADLERVRARPTRDNPSLIIVAGNPPPTAEMERAWSHFHQKDDYSGKTVQIGAIPGAPPYTFALGRLEDIDLGSGVQKVRPRPWLVCEPGDEALWIVSAEPMDATKIAGRKLHRVTYDPTAESGKEPAFYRHRFKEPLPVITTVGPARGCRAILLEGGRYSVRDWIYD